MKKKNENDYLSLKIVILIIVAFIVGLSEIFIEKNIVTGVFFMIFGVVVLSLVIAEKRNSKARNIQHLNGRLPFSIVEELLARKQK